VPGDLPPIGRPIANTQAYILNHHLPGAGGELYPGGEGLACGSLTATRFLPNPYGQSVPAWQSGMPAGRRQRGLHRVQ
jgi:non-ribosomal peptide synthetase component F